MFKRLLTAFIGLVALASPAFSQGTVRVCYMASPGICTDVSSTNPFPVLATVNASITGWPGTTQTTGTPISVTTGGVTGTLPTGAVVVATNDGATNTAYCKLGASSTTSDTPIYPHSSVSFTVGAATQLTCITSTSTTTVNMSGGSGLPTGWGGGSSSGGGGGVVTQPTAANLNATVVGTGTFVTQATLAAETTKVIGTVNQGTSPWVVSNGGTFATQATLQASATTAIGKVDPNTLGAWGLAASTQNVASPTNAMLIMGEFNTTPTTIASGNSSPLQLDASGNALVKVSNTNTNGSATSANSSPVVIASDNALPSGWKGQTTMSASVPVVIASNQSNVPVVSGATNYVTVAVSQTAQVLQVTTGATGDYLSHCVAYPTSTSPGVVTVFDNTSTAGNNVIAFAGGASSLSNLSPFSFPVGAISKNGAWKATTGANVILTCYGKFS